jgi:hypothetical protein
VSADISKKDFLYKAILPILILVISCACGLFSSDKRENRSEPVEISPDPEVALDAEQQIEGIDIGFRPLAGYQLENSAGRVSMLAPGADSSLGPVIHITRGLPRLVDSDQYLQRLLGRDGSGMEVLSKDDIRVGGKRGFRVELNQVRDEQILIVLVAQIQSGTINTIFVWGWAPAEQAGEFHQAFNTVLANLQFNSLTSPK